MANTGFRPSRRLAEIDTSKARDPNYTIGDFLRDTLDVGAGAMRGATAATLGVGGDLEGLLRSVLNAGAGPAAAALRGTTAPVSTTAKLPSSEDFRRWLPSAANIGPGGLAASGQELGALSAYSPATPLRPVAAAHRVTGRMLNRATAPLAARLQSSSLGQLSEAISELGGVEPVLRARLAAGRPIDPSTGLASMAVKPRGGNWYEGGLEGRLREYLEDLKAFGNEGPEGVPQAVNKWIDTQLRRYIMTHLGTAEDPLVALERELPQLHFPSAEDLLISSTRGGLRSVVYDDPNIPGRNAFLLEARTQGVPLTDVRRRQQLQAIAKERAGPDPDAWYGSLTDKGLWEPYVRDDYHIAKTGRLYRTPWENLSDKHVAVPVQARDLLAELRDFAGLGQPGEDLSRFNPRPPTSFTEVLERLRTDPESLRNMPGTVDIARQAAWLEKRPPTEWFHEFNLAPGEDPLNFREVVDYLRGSGLRPEQISRVSVADAVRGTAEMQRRAQAAALKAARASETERLQRVQQHLAKLQPYRTYEDPKLGRLGWYEYSAGMDPEDIAYGLSVDTCLFGHCVGSVGHGRYGYEGHIPMRDLITGKKVRPDLPDLNQYAENVLSGRSKIYSLRTAEGRPLATVEAESPLSEQNYKRVYNGLVNTGELPASFDRDRFIQYLRQRLWDVGGEPLSKSLSEFSPEAHAFVQEELSKLPSKLIQIKGRANAKPSPEAIPYIQDFVRKGNWAGNIGDLQNTDLIDLYQPGRLPEAGENLQLHDLIGRFVTPEELKLFREVGPERFLDELKARQRTGFARGGRVRSSDLQQFHRLCAEHRITGV